MSDSTDVGQPIEISGTVSVVTGGAGGIGKGIVRALLDEGSTVVIADVESTAIDAAVADLSTHGSVSGWVTDVSDFGSVEALADHVYATHGQCNLLFNNAGVTSGGGGKPWQQESNDWKWCFGVNVFGPAHCVSAFVPRMIDGGEPGHITNTSSGDGGFAPVPTASVYAASKAAVSCFSEALNHQLIREETKLRASVFYPSGGLMDTGLFTASRNRPEELQRVGAATGRKSMTFGELKKMLEDAGRDVPVADLDELGRFVVDGVRERRYIIAHNLDATAELLHARADAISEALLPPCHDMGI